MRHFIPAILLLILFVACDEPEKNVQELFPEQLIDSVEKLNQQFQDERRNNLEQAAVYAEKGLALSLEISYQPGIGDGYSNIGFVEYYRNNFPEALNAYLSALEIKETLNDSAGIGDCSYVLGKIHRSQGNYDKALEYSFRALEIQKARKDPGAVSSVLNGIGNIYSLMKQYDTAMTFYMQRMDLERQRGDSAGVASTLSDLGAAHTASGNPQEGLRYHLQSLEKLQGVRIDSSTWYLRKFKSGVLLDVAGDYILLGDYDHAVQSANESLMLAEATGARKEKRNAYKTLAEIYKATDVPAQEARYLSMYIKLNDSLLNEEGIRQIADADARYQSAQKEKNIAVLNTEKALLDLEVQRHETNRKLIFIGIGVCLLLGAIGAWIIYNRNRLKNQQEQFRAVIEGEENERKRIAMELHDGLGQLLSAARLNVSGLEDFVPKEDETALKNSLSLIDDACQEVRSISHNLMPAALIRLGLVAALREQAAKISQAGKVQTNFNSENFTAKLLPSEEMALYRIIQEVVNNALKYAMAGTITITLSGDATGVHAAISDDGIGMNSAQPDTGAGIGWKNIRSRVELLRGKLDIQSAPGKGTSVSIRINTTLHE